MAVFKLKNLKVGMVIAEDVKDINGRVLLKSGTKIIKENLKILKAWGITEADVRDVKIKNIKNYDTKNLKPEFLAEAEKEVLRIFHYADISHPAISELLNLCILRKAKLISEKETKVSEKS